MKAKYVKSPAERVVKDVRRATRKQYGAEEKIRIVLEGLRGEDSIAEFCHTPLQSYIQELPDILFLLRAACLTIQKRCAAV